MPQKKQSERVRLFLCDDHQLFREGLKALLDRIEDFECCGEASNGREALERLSDTKANVALLDINMPELDGLEVAQVLREQRPQMRTILLTTRKDPTAANRAMKIGVSGFILKDNAFDELETAIRQVATGGSYVSAGLAGAMLSMQREALDDKGRLSPREQEVLRYVAKALTNDEIATQLGVSVTTVRTHRRRLMEKLDLHSASELTRYALERGLV